MTRLHTHRFIALLFLLVFLTATLFAGGKKEGPKEYPFTNLSLDQLLSRRNDTSFMADALKNTGLAGQMNELKGYTLFIPTDATVAKLQEIVRTAMMDNPEALLTVLQAQMVKGVLDAEDLSGLDSVTTIGNITMELGKRGKKLTLNRSDIQTANLFGNGFVVHTVTGLIVPTIRPR